MHGVVDLCAEFDVRKPVSNDTIFFCRADKNNRDTEYLPGFFSRKEPV